MPWRGLIIVGVLVAVLAAYVATDTGARLLISGRIAGEFGGVRIGDEETEAVALLSGRFGEPTIIAPEPAARFRIRPYERYVFRDPAPFAAVIVVEVRDGRVFRVRELRRAIWLAAGRLLIADLCHLSCFRERLGSGALGTEQINVRASG